MASEDDSQEKTEEPTQRRIEKAREDGQVLNSKEMFVFATTFTGMIIILALSVVVKQWIGYWGGFFRFDPGDGLSDLLPARLSARGARSPAGAAPSASRRWLIQAPIFYGSASTIKRTLLKLI